VSREVGAALNRDIDVEKTEQVEGALDAFIEVRHAKRVKEEGDRLQEELWRESERRHAQKRRSEIREEWCAHHTEQAARLRAALEDLVRRHELEAQKLGG